jgi:hypothetical protein
MTSGAKGVLPLNPGFDFLRKSGCIFGIRLKNGVPGLNIRFDIPETRCLQKANKMF